MRRLGGWSVGLVLFVNIFCAAMEARAQVSPLLEGKGSVAGNSGAFAYSVPIEVPPGRHGLTPQLALTYNSSSGNGFLGVGWDLPIGYVMRSTKYGVDYYCNPSSSPNPCYVFMIDGASSELIPRTDWCSDCFGARIEGAFMRFRYVNGSYWEVTDKSGTKYLFGQTTASRQDGTIPNNVPVIFKWALDTVTDTHNNVITYSYFKDQGEIYIDYIDYPANHVRFNRDPTARTDKPMLYGPNFAVTTAYRLGSIDVLANWNGSSGTIVRTYGLGYCGTTGITCPISSTGRSLIGKVTTYGSDGSSVSSPLTFQWSSAGNSVTAPQMWLQEPGTFVAGSAHYADVNGDGKADLIFQGSDNAFYVSLSTGTGFSSPVLWVQEGASVPGQVQYADVNGDGKADSLYFDTSRSNGEWVGLSTGSGFTTQTNWMQQGTSTPNQIQYADVNGDGKADSLFFDTSRSNGEWVGLSTGSGFTTQTNWMQQGTSTPDQIQYADVNGDGKADSLFFDTSRSNGEWVGLSTGSGFTTQTNWMQQGTSTPDQIQYADVNGDGKADSLYFDTTRSSGVWVGLSTGSGFAAQSMWEQEGASMPGQVRYADVNGDGKADALYFDFTRSNGVWVALSTGNGFATQTMWVQYTGSQYPGAPSVAQVQYADVNGDGLTDVIYQGNDNKFWVSLSTGTVPDLLTSISNGIGGSTSINYSPSSTFWTSSDTHWNLPFITQVVPSITVCDNYNGSSCIGNSSVTNYSYTSGYYNASARELRGFFSVKATNATNGNSTETLYHQGSGVTAVADDASVVDGYTVSRPYQITVKDGGGITRSQKTLTYWADADSAAPWFTPLKQEDNYIYEPSGVSKHSQSIYTYDDQFKDTTYTGVYGNLTKEEYYADLSVPTDYKQIRRGFVPNTSPWIVGLPSYEKVYDTSGATNLKSATVFHYDGVQGQGMPTGGNLTQIGRWLNQGAGSGCDSLASVGVCLFTNMTYDSTGNLLTATDANGYTTTLCYDTTGTFQQKATNAKGQTTLTDYYGVTWNTACGTAPAAYAGAGLYGQIKSVTDSNGQQATSSYDSLGRKSQVNAPDGSSVSLIYPCVTSTGCTPDPTNLFGSIGSQYIKTNTSVGLSSWVYFDGFGRTIREKKTGPDSKIIRVDTAYNNLGQVTSATLPYFDGGATNGSTTFAYDIIGRKIQVTNPDTSRTLFCYSLGDTATIDPNNHMRRERRNGHGELEYVDEYTGAYSVCPTTYPGSAYATTAYVYDLQLGNLLSVTDNRANVTSIQYDSLSRKTSMTDPDMGTWGYLYDSVGNLTKQTDAKNQNIFFQYDAINRILQKDYTTQKALGSGDVRYSYDTLSGFAPPTYFETGRLTQVIDSSGTVKFGYDKMGRITRTEKTVDTTTYVTQSSYDTGGRALSVTYPDGDVVSYSYNGPFLDKVYGTSTTYVRYPSTAFNASYLYNALAQPGMLTYGNGVSTNYTYSNTANPDCTAQNFMLCKITTTKAAATYQNLRYSYLTGGNVSAVTDALSTAGLHVNQNQTFGYDDLNRITSATGPYGSLTYAYNSIGNLICNSAISACTVSTPNYTYGDLAHKQAVTNAGGSFPMSYDLNGNMTSHSTDTLTYDMENRVSSFANGGVTTSFIYDGDGGRVKKTKSGVTMVFIGKLFECAAPCYTGGVWSGTKHIFAGSVRIASKPITTTGDIFYYHPDRLGSASVVTDKNGADYSEFVYRPFGDTYSMTGTDINYKYTGQLKDNETGLYFYGSRYYDARVGRFISPDTIVPMVRNPQALNRYSYVLNSPMMYIDPTGHDHVQCDARRTCTTISGGAVALPFPVRTGGSGTGSSGGTCGLISVGTGGGGGSCSSDSSGGSRVPVTPVFDPCAGGNCSSIPPVGSIYQNSPPGTSGQTCLAGGCIGAAGTSIGMGFSPTVQVGYVMAPGVVSVIPGGSPTVTNSGSFIIADTISFSASTAAGAGHGGISTWSINFGYTAAQGFSFSISNTVGGGAYAGLGVSILQVGGQYTTADSVLKLNGKFFTVGAEINYSLIPYLNSMGGDWITNGVDGNESIRGFDIFGSRTIGSVAVPISFSSNVTNTVTVFSYSSDSGFSGPSD